MRPNRVDYAREDDGEQHVPVEVAPLGNGAGHDGGASGGKCGLTNGLLSCFIKTVLRIWELTIHLKKEERVSRYL